MFFKKTAIPKKKKEQKRKSGTHSLLRVGKGRKLSSSSRREDRRSVVVIEITGRLRRSGFRRSGGAVVVAFNGHFTVLLVGVGTAVRKGDVLDSRHSRDRRREKVVGEDRHAVRIARGIARSIVAVVVLLIGIGEIVEEVRVEWRLVGHVGSNTVALDDTVDVLGAVVHKLGDVIESLVDVLGLTTQVDLSLRRIGREVLLLLNLNAGLRAVDNEANDVSTTANNLSGHADGNSDRDILRLRAATQHTVVDLYAMVQQRRTYEWWWSRRSR